MRLDKFTDICCGHRFTIFTDGMLNVGLTFNFDAINKAFLGFVLLIILGNDRDVMIAMFKVQVGMGKNKLVEKFQCGAIF